MPLALGRCCGFEDEVEVVVEVVALVGSWRVVVLDDLILWLSGIDHRPLYVRSPVMII